MNIRLAIRDQRGLSIICFSLFSAWMLSFPFEGQILYALLKKADINQSALVLTAVCLNFVGLFIAGFLVRRQDAARVTMIASLVVCLAGSLIFFLPLSALSYMAIAAVALFSGLFVASWGFYFKAYSQPEQRLRTAADVLIYSNIGMIIINVIAVNVSATFALGLAILSLLGALFVTFRLETGLDEGIIYPAVSPKDVSTMSQPFILLSLFILVITINSGLMYQVVNPAFAHYEFLVSYYWAIPYVAALLVVRSLPAEIKRAYILYVALIMIGLSYILFMQLDRSVISYLIIDTLMLGAFGVCDLFWWSILSGVMDYWHNPAQVLGVGLSMNVLGIFLGGIIGSQIQSAQGGHQQASVMALVVIFAVMILLPLLNFQLTNLLRNHTFLIQLDGRPENKRSRALSDFKHIKQLTAREAEVIKLLLQGYTYKAIAESLFISENTMKFHVKNIYHKLNVNNKMELIKLFADNRINSLD